jgi:hypothetical protein
MADMKRIRWVFALAFFLVFAQQGALLHELSHVHAAGSQQIRYEESLAAGKFCETCVAYAQVGNPAAASLPILPLVAAVRHDLSEPVYAILAAEVPAPRSRGPPHA